jgi:cobaltochelatase CobN
VASRHGLDKDIGITDEMDKDTRLARLDAHLCDLKELQIRDGLHILGESPEGGLLTDLLSALVRVPRGGEARQNSLQRALSEDLGFSAFDPLNCDFAAPWIGAKLDVLASVSDAPWRSNGDTVERLELLAQQIISGI